MEDPDNSRKVLSLIWNTEQDRLQLDMKVSFSSKQQGARLDPDVEEKVDYFLSEVISVITKRILWQEAQGQYDPLGWLCVYTIQFKMLMRNLTDESGKVIV
jgi:hypothetical protein